jgi:alkanesulfonate monooxygenase SsuD/methylene tetrahydromethanopterin reductase-like flavin-dependent oxidoreductase (luciferase family)
LAAIAGRTNRIRLGSAVTVLSSDDPIRVFQRFATLDAASNGRAEIILGRGSFIESFRSSATRWISTRRSSRRSWSCSPRCSRRIAPVRR